MVPVVSKIIKMISVITNKQDQNRTRFPVVDYFFFVFLLMV